MPIVSQSASASYSHFPVAQLLLPAPRIAGLLSAPQISGLLTAGTPSKPRSCVAQQFDAWAAADAELNTFLAGARARLIALRADLMLETRAYRVEGLVCHA